MMDITETEVEEAREFLQIDVIRLIALLRRNGVSIRAIAKSLGESKSTIHRWVTAIEHNERLLSQQGQAHGTEPQNAQFSDGALSQRGQSAPPPPTGARTP